jgi:DNA polymerase III sliding clamp (beta) subunit (PCNA family)
MTVSRKELILGLSASSVMKITPASVLGNLKISADDGILTIMESNTVQQGTMTLYAAGSLPVTLFPAKKFLDIVKAGKSDLVDIAPGLVDGTVCEPAPDTKIENFPVDNRQVSNDLFFSFDADYLRGIVDFLLPFVSDDGTRYFMNGICLQHEEGTGYIRLIATNGRTMAYKQIEDSRSLPAFTTIIGPEFLKLPKKFTGTVNLFFDTLTKCGRLDFYHASLSNFKFSRVFGEICGEFPNYKRVIPKTKLETGIKFNPADMLEALKKVAPSLTKKKERILLDYTAGAASLTVSVQDEKMEKTLCSVSIPACGNTSLESAVNPLYVADCLQYLPAETVLQFIDGGHAFKIETAESIRLVMPMARD